MWKLIEGALGGVVDKSRRRFIKGVAGAGALAALPKGVKMLMKPASDEIPYFSGPFYESPFFVNMKKKLYDEEFKYMVSTSAGSFNKAQFQAIADQVSRRTGKSLEELGLKNLDTEGFVKRFSDPEIIKDTNTADAVRLFERHHGVDDFDGNIENLVNDEMAETLTIGYSNRIDDQMGEWVRGEISLDQIEHPKLVEYMKSLEKYNWTREQTAEYIEDSIDVIGESSSIDRAQDVFDDTVRPKNMNEDWEEVLKRKRDSEISDKPFGWNDEYTVRTSERY